MSVMVSVCVRPRGGLSGQIGDLFHNALEKDIYINNDLTLLCNSIPIFQFQKFTRTVEISAEFSRGLTGHHPTYRMQRFSKLCACSMSLSTCVGTFNSTVGLKSRPIISKDHRAPYQSTCFEPCLELEWLAH